MAAIKSVNRSASVALAPDSPYMAAGTMAGAVDLSFSSSACLEVFKLDFQSEDHDLPVVGECQSSERFNRLAWGRNGSGSDTYGLGLIAGGLVDGNIDIWNPLSLIRSEASENALVGHLSRHKGPVRGLEFNSIAPNLLASGADDGEICIWDLAAPLEPSHFPPLKGTGSASQGEISYVSWNCRVQHILASTSSNGITVVWDLKKQKPAISFGDSIRRRCSVLQWHPDVATQLVVASDEDGSPSLRLWDMRNIIEPVKEFVGHTKGVIGMSWCPNDSSYLLTCAKDNRTICWNTVTAEIVCELPAGTNWNFDVHWYPWMPGVISASSFDGKIGIYNIEGCSRYTAGDNDFGRAKLRAPKWCERPGLGLLLGLEESLYHFALSYLLLVFLHNLVTEDSLVSRSSEFESAIQNGEKSLVKALCDKKSQESESADDRETWGFLKVMFEEDGTARTRMLAHLGFSVPIEEKDAEQENGLNQQINAIRLDDTPTDKEGYENNKEATIFSADDGEDFFNNLPSPKADASSAPSGDNLDLGNSAPIVEEISQEPETLEESADPSFDDSIQRALVLGDYKGAVAQCISANKIADALVIAHAGGTSLWENTLDQYLKLSPSPYLKIVAAMVNNDLLTLVNTRPLKYWKETLALLCTFAPSEEWSMLCNSLASKLMAAGNTLAATLCYICAGNIDKTVEIWSRSLSAEREGKSYIDLLQDLMEKTIVLALANGQKQFSASFCKLVEKYAEILASQGLLTTALEYLKLLGSDDLSPELTIIRDRIALSMKPEKEAKTPAFDNTQQQGGTFYGAKNPGFGVADASHPYYQGAAAQQMHQSVAEGPYTENYQQPIDSSYGRGFGAPAPFQPSPPPAYQPAPPPQMFIPTPTPQAPQTNFTPLPPHAASQQPTRPFVPANVPMLRNAEQYQQPTLGSQLYPGTANPAYNTVQPPTGSQGPITAQVGVAQRPGIGSMQPPNTTQPASLQAAVVPAAPPPTVQTVDTSNVPAHHRPVITTLTRLFKETSEALGGARANPARKREIEDNSRKIALQIQVLLTTSEWDECNFWLATLKRMIKTRQGAGVRSS
ncbi:hypothetical protein OIU76_020409 [Salix suchowensis]|nr:hypothetical protein OIU76_020409 [Salix suchowensis]